MSIELSGKKVTVIGLGITGFYTALYLSSRKARVFVNDIKPEGRLNQEYVNRLKNLNIELKTGGYDERGILESDMIVISPGVPKDLSILKKAKELNIPVIAEMELAYRMIKKPIIAITGTNGKSTVTSLIGHILKCAGIKVFVGGNIGRPLISYLVHDKSAIDIIVLEVSSYQLDGIEKFSPFISIILNITPDHLDRYTSFNEYVNSKLKIFKNQEKGSYVILNDDDSLLANARPPSEARVLRYGVKRRQGRIAFIENRGNSSNSSIRVCFNKKELKFSLKNRSLLGLHNTTNLMPAIISSLILDVDKRIIQDAINGFKGLPHRLEPVLEKNGILFIDDSKATNVDSTVKAINSINRPIILIAGGKDKGLDYRHLARMAKGKVKHAIFIGETALILAKEFKNLVSSETAQDMYEAVSKAYSKAEKGEAILLSPACSSFDMFRDYSHRGETFKDAIRRIFDDSKGPINPPA